MQIIQGATCSYTIFFKVVTPRYQKMPLFKSESKHHNDKYQKLNMLLITAGSGG
jgi:hypothetical protein